MTGFYFWPHTENSKVASYRIRCKLVLEFLKDKCPDSALYRSGCKPKVLVLSKRYDRASIAEAKNLKASIGTQIILDLCDNHFYSQTEDVAAFERADILREAINSVDIITTTSEYLADVIREELSCDVPIVIIGDIVEPNHCNGVIDKVLHFPAYLQLRKLEGLFKQSNAIKLVWFGNHGSNFVSGGMEDVLLLESELRKLGKSQAISLTIISNSREKYQSLLKNIPCQTFYVEWNECFFSSYLKLHDAIVIPVSKNPFTLSKSANRVTTGIAHGLQVYADDVPSYREFDQYIHIGNLEKELADMVQYDKSSTKLFNLTSYNDVIIDKWWMLLQNTSDPMILGKLT